MRTIPRATFTAVLITAGLYAFASWALAVGVGRSRILDESARLGPDLVFAFLGERSAVLANVASALFVLSLVAALLAFHNAVARYFFALGRAGVLPAVFARTGRGGAPVAGSLAQSAIGLTVVAGFVVAGRGSDLGELYPVLTLFTWLTNAAGFGVVFLLAVTSVAVIVWSNRPGAPGGLLVRWAAPLVSVVALSVIGLLVLVNFDLMIGDAGPASLRWVMPGVILASGAVGLMWGEVLRRRRPEVFAGVGESLDRIKV